MLKSFCLFLLFAINLSVVNGQSVPHIAGNVKITMAEGLIQCNFDLSNLPNLGKKYKILLYRGFNIKLLNNDTGRVLRYSGYYDEKLQGEATAYLPSINNDTLKLPEKLHISYTGAFPIYSDTLNAFDFKGLIAFNGKTLRAAEQSKWYPVIYDIKNDKEILDVTYDIKVECKDCKTIYINGAKAESGPSAKFTSNKPRKLLLFTGDYTKQSLSKMTFLNANLTADEARVFDRNINDIIDFYSTYLRLPYNEKITFLQHQSVAPQAPKSSWGFVAFPTIAISGTTFKSQVNMTSGLFKATSLYHFYAHEMGHYYFGQKFQPNSTLRWFFLESMAEFLSIKATEAKYGATATKDYIAEKKAEIKGWKIKALSKISNSEDIGEGYRYNYAPLILLAMEKRFGSKVVQLFCQRALQNAGLPTDYSFFLSIIKEAGINGDDWKLFENEVINQTVCSDIFDHL